MSGNRKVQSVWEFAVRMVAFHLLFAGLSQACVCGPFKSFMEIYCSSHFVIRAVPVTSVYDPPGSNQFEAMQRIYNISVVQVFKGPADMKGEELWTIYTGPNEHMCGAVLDENTEYLLTGKVYGGEAMMNTCTSWIMPWSQLLPWEKTGVRRNYKRYCPHLNNSLVEFK